MLPTLGECVPLECNTFRLGEEIERSFCLLSGYGIKQSRGNCEIC